LITTQVKVEKLVKIAESVMEITMSDENQQLLPSYTCGAHIDLYFPNGITRAYSLTQASSNQPMQQYVVAVGLAPKSRGGSEYVHSILKVGDLLSVGQPRNLFKLVQDTLPVLLIAGGIGITPLRAMALDLNRQGRAWRLVYAARSRSHAAYAKELTAFGDSVQFHFDDEHENRPLEVDKLLSDIPAQTHIYCCGPTAMMELVRKCAAKHSPDHLHFESFNAASDLQSNEGHSFSVLLAREGKTIDISNDQTILDALETHGIVVPSVCREGVCGSCECTVLEGDIDHRDVILSAEEKAAGQTMMICVSRAKGNRLVLDL
jgi:ferredoxin-NADP reductase